MPKKERAGNLDLPQWWLDIAIAQLDETDERQESLARRASVYAGRVSPWDKTAITKFKRGVGRTIDLANALSAVLGIVAPVFIAPTESAAKIIAEIVRAELLHLDEKNAKLAVVDRRVAEQIQKSAVDAAVRRGVRSSDHGAPGGHESRSRSSRRGRS